MCCLFITNNITHPLTYVYTWSTYGSFSHTKVNPAAFEWFWFVEEKNNTFQMIVAIKKEILKKDREIKSEGKEGKREKKDR